MSQTVVYTRKIKSIHRVVNFLEENASHFEKDIRDIELEMAGVKIDYNSLKSQLDFLEDLAKSILQEVDFIKEELAAIKITTSALAKGIKTISIKITSISKNLDRISSKALMVEKKITGIRQKLGTASPQHPFVKHYKFRVTK